jgi:hypothetical protein
MFDIAYVAVGQPHCGAGKPVYLFARHVCFSGNADGSTNAKMAPLDWLARAALKFKPDVIVISGKPFGRVPPLVASFSASSLPLLAPLLTQACTCWRASPPTSASDASRLASFLFPSPLPPPPPPFPSNHARGKDVIDGRTLPPTLRPLHRVQSTSSWPGSLTAPSCKSLPASLLQFFTHSIGDPALVAAIASMLLGTTSSLGLNEQELFAVARAAQGVGDVPSSYVVGPHADITSQPVTVPAVHVVADILHWLLTR